MAVVEFKSGLVFLVRSVRTYFETYGVTATVALGQRAYGSQINQGPGGANRVTFLGHDESGKSGKLTQPLGPGERTIRNDQGVRIGSTRSLRSWVRTITACVWVPGGPGADEEDIEDALYALLESTNQAINHTGFAMIEPSDVTTTVDPKELSYGRELKFSFTMNLPLYDLQNTVAYPTLGTITKKLDEPFDP